MKLLRLEICPDGCGYGTSAAFDEYDLEALIAHETDLAAYWYSREPYEGSGQLVFRAKGKWGLHDCGHCSYYGPVERIPVARWDSLDDVLANCSAELAKEVAPLVEMLKPEATEN